MTFFKTRKAVRELLTAVVLLNQKLDRLEYAMDRFAERDRLEWNKSVGLWQRIKKTRKNGDKADDQAG